MRRRWFGVFLTLLVSVSSLAFALSTPTPAYAASGIGCPQGPAGPPSPTANYPCPEGGAVQNGVYKPETLLGCPGKPPAPITNNYDCLSGGKVVNGEYVPAGGTAQNTPVNGDTTPPQKCDGGANFTWVVCGVIEFFVGDNGVVNAIRDKAIVPFMEGRPLAKYSAPNTPTPIYKIWSSLRNVASVFFILVFFLVIIGTALGFDNYTIKKIMPHLVAGAILVPFSWELCAFVIDLGNVIGKGLPALMDPLIGHVTIDIKENWTNFFGLGGAAIAGGFALYAGAAAMGLAGVISLVIALAGVFLTLIMRQILITLFVVLSPFAILAWILPNTEKWFKTWWQNLFKLVMMYPIIMLLFEAGRIFASVAGSTVTGSTTAQGVADNVAPLVQILALVMPLFLVPFAFKFAGSGLNMAGGMVNRFTGMAEKKWGKSSDGAKEAAENRARKNLIRGKDLESAAGKADNVFKKRALNAGSRLAYRRAGFAKAAPWRTNVTGDLKRESAFGKATAEQGTWNANEENSAQGIPGETAKERVAAETIMAQQKKISERGQRKGLVKDQSEMSPAAIAAGNRAIMEAGAESSRRSQNQKRSTAEGEVEAAAENYQSGEKLREYNKDHGYIHAAEERQKIDGTLDMDQRRNEQIKQEYEAANPGKKISLHDAHMMRMENIKNAANIAGGNDVLKKDIDSAAAVQASNDATTAEIERSIAAGQGPISVRAAQNARIKTAVAAGISQGRAQKLKAEAGDMAYMDVENAAGGQQKASELIAGERLLQRPKMADQRMAAQGALDADADNHIATSDMLETSRYKAAKDFGGTIGTQKAERQAMESEARMDNNLTPGITAGTTAAYQAAAKRTVGATASVRGRALTESFGKEQGVIVADNKELERAQEEYLKANPNAGAGSIPTAESVRNERLLNAAYDAQGASASQTTAAYADIAGGANEYNKDVERYQAENPTATAAEAQNAVTSRNLSNISTTGRLAAQNKYRKENDNRQGNVDQYQQRVSAAADTIQAADPALSRGQAEAAAVDKVDTDDLNAIGIAARQDGAMSGRKVTDDAHGTVAGIESQVQQETPAILSQIESQVQAEAQAAGAALPPAMAKQRAADRLANMTTSQRAQTVQATNVAAASTANTTAAAEKQRIDTSKAPGTNIAHEAAIKQAYIEEKTNTAFNDAIDQGKSSTEAQTIADTVRETTTKQVTQGSIAREDLEQASLTAVARAAQDQATRSANQTDAQVAATNRAISDTNKLTESEQLEVDTENLTSQLATKRGADRALWRETKPGADLNRNFALAAASQERVVRDQVFDQRVQQAKKELIRVPRVDEKGKAIYKNGQPEYEETMIDNMNLSDDALGTIVEDLKDNLQKGRYDRAVALGQKLGSVAKGRGELRKLQKSVFRGSDTDVAKPDLFDGQAKIIWDKMVSGVPFAAAPDLVAPPIAVFKGKKPKDFAAMDWRTQEQYLGYVNRPDTVARDSTLYKQAAAGVAKVAVNQNSANDTEPEQMRVMADFLFKRDKNGRLDRTQLTEFGEQVKLDKKNGDRALDNIYGVYNATYGDKDENKLAAERKRRNDPNYQYPSPIPAAPVQVPSNAQPDYSNPIDPSTGKPYYLVPAAPIEQPDQIKTD